MSIIDERLTALRACMAQKKIDYYVIPSQDAHLSEYVAPYWKARAYFSGFTGSAGTLIVGAKEACLWVDGRYHVQGAAETAGTGVTLFKMGLDGVETIDEWLKRKVTSGKCLGYDGRMVGARQGIAWQKMLVGPTLICDCDLAGEVWQDRPSMPTDPVYVLSTELAGESCVRKLARVRKHLTEKNADALLLSSLDDIAWLLNLRGNDVLHSPVFYSYFFLTQDKAMLFIQEQKLGEEARALLQEAFVEIHPYDGLTDVLKQEGTGKPRLLLNPAKVNMLVYTVAAEQFSILPEMDITTWMKAAKNKAQQQFIRKAHEMDGAVMVQFIRWLKNRVQDTQHPLNEVDASDYLDNLRLSSGAFDLSFGTIAGYGSNGAIVHYGARRETAATLKPEGLMVVDSGGQYKEGTTDITRTIALGPLTERMKHIYTLVLKGHLALGRAVFMNKTPGYYLDILAREPLWKEGLDYRHGTGHGVGHVLCVHEGPQNIGHTYVNADMEEGVLISDEPGYYAEGEFGVRIENLCLVQDAMTTPDGHFLRMDPVTLCPYEVEAIDSSMLDATEKQQIADYHERVRNALKPYLSSDDYQWLVEYTKNW